MPNRLRPCVAWAARLSNDLDQPTGVRRDPRKVPPEPPGAVLNSSTTLSSLGSGQPRSRTALRTFHLLREVDGRHERDLYGTLRTSPTHVRSCRASLTSASSAQACS